MTTSQGHWSLSEYNKKMNLPDEVQINEHDICFLKTNIKNISNFELKSLKKVAKYLGIPKYGSKLSHQIYDDINKVLYSDINDNTLMFFGQYKGKPLSTVIKDIGYVNWLLKNSIKNCEELVIINWLKKNITKTICGKNLTKRIKSFLQVNDFSVFVNKFCPTNWKVTRDIISIPFNKFIIGIHHIKPDLAGNFIDYLVRRGICELLSIQFKDRSADLAQTVSSINDTKFPFNLDDSYKVSKNLNNKTKDILYDVFIVSLTHFYRFGNLDTSNANLIINFIKNSDFQFDITDIQSILSIFNPKEIALNPELGISKKFPAEADLILDNNLLDIKVTKFDNDNLNFLQLIGYASLCNLRDYKINKIHVLNLYQNKIQSIDISYLENTGSKFLEIMELDLQLSNLPCQSIELIKLNETKSWWNNVQDFFKQIIFW